MKKIIIILFAVLKCCSPALAQDKKISQLTALPSVNGTELIPVAKSGANYYMTTNQFKNWAGSIDTTKLLHTYGTTLYPLIGGIEYRNNTDYPVIADTIGNLILASGDRKDFLNYGSAGSYLKLDLNGSSSILSQNDGIGNSPYLILNKNQSSFGQTGAATSNSTELDIDKNGNSFFTSGYPNYSGLSYETATAGYVTANQNGYSILHRAANDARYLPIGNTITINGSVKTFSTNPTFTISSTTSVTASSPLSVTSGSAIAISQANTSTNGYLSSTDWNTFNGKSPTLTLTTTGTNGVSTLTGGALNIPIYQGNIVSVNTQTASYTLATSDVYKIVRMAVTSDVTVTVPNSSNATYSIGDIIQVQRYGTGRVDFAEANGVHIKSANRKLSIYGENGLVYLKKTATNEWELWGDTDWILDYDFKQFNNRLVNKIPDVQSNNLNLFITGLKNYNGVDSLNKIFDYQYFFGGLSTQSNANLNVISSSYSITASSTPPTWGSNGYTGGSTKYLKNGFNDKAKGKALSLNDEVMYAYCNTDPGGTLEMEMGNFDDASYNTLNTCLSSNYSGIARGAISNKAQTSNTNTTVTSGIGLTAVERKGNNVILWKNGSIISSGVFVPDSLESQENYILAVKYGTATAGLRFSTKEVYSVGKGSAYNLDQQDYYNRFYNFKNGYVAPPKAPVGTIFYDYFSAGSISSNYSNSTGAFTVSGGHAVATNTTASMWTKPLTYTAGGYTCGFERTITDLYETVDNTSSKGVAISYNGLYNNLQVLFNFSTKKIEYYNSVGTNSLTVSTSTLAISNGDNIHVSVRDHKGLFTTTVYNLTTGLNISTNYDYAIIYPQTNIRPSAYQPTLYACGGTQNVTYWGFSSQVETNADVAFIGDSNFFRFYQSYKSASIVESIGVGHSWFAYGGPGLKTGDINWSEVVAAAPKQVVINLGTNDVYNAVPIATSTANIQTGVTALEAAGIKVIICKVPPLNFADVRPYNTQLATTFGSRVGPDLFTAYPRSVGTPYQWLDGTYTPDYIHINLAGVSIAVNTITPYIKW